MTDRRDEGGEWTQASANSRGRRLTWGRFLLFCFVWLMVGYTCGVPTLLAPVEWIADTAREAGWADETVSLVQKGIILLYAVITFLIALALTRLIVRKKSRAIAMGVIIPLLITTSAAGWLMLQPQYLPQGEAQELTTRFTSGPYPREEDLQRLKDEGYTAVISLLHPAVLPSEPILLDRKRAHLERIGLELIHIPMLPWVRENEDSIERIRELSSIRAMARWA